MSSKQEDFNFLKDANNRAYYAVFYTIKSVLAIEGIDFKRHKDVLAYFNKEYVAPGKFPRDLGKRIGKLKMVREASDYDDFYVCTLEETKEQLETTQYALKLIEEF